MTRPPPHTVAAADPAPLDATPPDATPPDATPPEATLPEAMPPEATPPEATPPEATPPEEALRPRRPPEAAWPESPALDEIGVAVGPDRDGIGLFDAPVTGTSTGEHTERPPTNEAPRGGSSRRTAVLAWIAAQPLPATPPVGDGAPCGPLKRLIADEPLDPLPPLDGVPQRTREPARRATDRDVADLPPNLAPEREDTATQIEGFESMLDRRERRGTLPADPDTVESDRASSDGVGSDSGPRRATRAKPDPAGVGDPAADLAGPKSTRAPARPWGRSARLLLVAAFTAALVAWLLEASR